MFAANGSSFDTITLGNGAGDTVSAYFSGARAADPPPWKWSDLRYVFDIKEDCKWEGNATRPEKIVAKLRQVDVLVTGSRPQ